MKLPEAERSLWASCKWPIYLITFSLALTACFYFFLLLSSTANNERSSKIYEQSLIASINQYEYLPSLLAQDTLLVNTLLGTEDPAAANKKLDFTASRSGADAIYIMDIQGNVIATSNHETTQTFLGRNYSFRPYFTEALSKLSRQFYYAKGATTGIPGFFISSPIIHNNEAIGVAVVKLTMDYWEENWYDSAESIITTDKNGVIILTSKEQWRYRSTGDLQENVAQRITAQQQFLGREHKSLYSETLDITLFRSLNITFWIVDKKLYIAHKFPIPEIEWTLYSLVSHAQVLYSAFTFFFVTASLSLSFYLIYRERRYRKEYIHKNQQLELNHKEELKAVIDNIHIGVTLFSSSGELLSVNDHAKHLLFNGELPPPEQSIYIDEIVNINFKELDELLLNDVAAPAYHEAYAFNDNGSIPVMFALSKVSAMNRPLYLMTIVNITRRKDAEEQLLDINNSLEDTIEARTQQLHKAQATLIQKNKAAALGNMAATIVHELSQPLAAMNSTIAAVCVKLEHGDSEGALSSSSRLNHLSNKMYNVIKLLKYFSYKDADTENMLDVSKTIEDSLDIFKETLHEKGISLRYQTFKRKVLSKANPLKIDLVFSNIVKNAIDASESNASPKISVKLKTTEDQQALIIISDNGGGIDEKIMKNMFNPYFTTKQVGKGLGLGLSITYEIIQEYGGKISVKNTKEGAQFTIMLPIYQPEADSINEAQQTNNNPNIHKKRHLGHG